jgi:hypothetical protein
MRPYQPPPRASIGGDNVPCALVIERPNSFIYAANHAVEIHRNEAPPEHLCRVPAVHDEAPEAVRLERSPFWLNVFELSRRIDALHIGRKVGFSRDADEPMFHRQVAADHVSPNPHMLGLIFYSTLGLVPKPRNDSDHAVTALITLNLITMASPSEPAVLFLTAIDAAPAPVTRPLIV